MKINYPKHYKFNNNHITKYISKYKFDDNIRFLFTGIPGSGKTYLANILFDQLIPDIKDNLTQDLRKQYSVIKCKNIYKEYLQFSNGSINDKDHTKKILYGHFKKNIILDDVGDERPSTVKSHEFIGGIIEDICDNIVDGHTCNVIITTNLCEKQIKEYYNLDKIDRVYDRVMNLFTIFQFNNYSFRKQNRKIIRRTK